MPIRQGSPRRLGRPRGAHVPGRQVDMKSAARHREQSVLHQSAQGNVGIVAAIPIVVEQIMLKPICQPRTSVVVRLDPQQELARAVLAQAVADACNLTIDERERLAAAAFLLDGAEVLWFWCAVGGLDPRVVRRYARQLFDHPQEFELLATRAGS